MHSMLTVLLVVCVGLALASSAHAFAVDDALFKRDAASSLSAIDSAASMVTPKSLRLGLPAAAMATPLSSAALLIPSSVPAADVTKGVVSSTFSGPASLAATASAFIASTPVTSGAAKSVFGGDAVNVLGTALGVGVLLWSSAQAAW